MDGTEYSEDNPCTLTCPNANYPKDYYKTPDVKQMRELRYVFASSDPAKTKIDTIKWF